MGTALSITAIFERDSLIMARDLSPRVVVVGTGWAGYRFISNVDRTRFNVIVISPRDHFVFTPLLAVTILVCFS